MEEKFYIVAERILSNAMKKTVKVKELLKNGEETQIKEAVEKMGLSRSTYYKYKDYIFPFEGQEQEELVNLSLLAVDKAGVLSEVLTKIASYRGNILTINQDIPLAQVAHVTLTMQVNNLKITLEGLIEELEKIKGIRKVKLIGQSFVNNK